MNNEQLIELLKKIINPNTQKSLQEENRIIEIKIDQDKLYFKYKRDGISPAHKREIENEILSLASPHITEDNITVLTVSENNSSDISLDLSKQEFKKTPSAPAQIKAGHGPQTQNKKKVQGVKHVIAISSCKGGVGKSTVAVNLAFALKNMGKKVGLLDADIYGPSIPMLLNQREAKPSASEQKKILPVIAYDVPFISFGLFVNEGDPVIWRGPMLGGVLNQFLFDVEWGELDYLILDLPPGTGDMQLSMVQATDIDGAIVVSTPQDVALLDSKKGFKMFHQVKTPIIGMIENMSYFAPDDALDKKYFIFGEGGVKKAAEELGTHFLGEIPLEIALRKSADSGKPYMNEGRFEGRPVWNAYMSVAKNIDQFFQESQSPDRPKGFFKRLFS